MIKKLVCLCVVAILLLITGCPVPERKPVITQEPPVLIPPPTPRPTPKPPTPSVKIPALGTLKGKTIVVDAGHGGKDPGSMGTGFSTMAEKKINLSIANEITRQLKARGAKVINTRTSDRFLELQDRAAIAERYDADLFIAIHSNSHPDSSRRGAVIYVARQPSRQSVVAAMKIDQAIRSAGIASDTDRADYKVLTLHSRPAVLVECGYLSNYSDCKRLNSSAYRCQIASAIVRGINDYFAR